MKKKLASRAGLTLVELLVSILLLALIGVGMSAGMTAAIRTYDRSVFSSETLMLQDTINTTLSDYLRYAVGVTGADGSVTVTSGQYGTGTFVTGRGNASAFTQGDGYLYFSANGKNSLVVNSGAYTTLSVTDFSIAYTAATGVFHVSYELQSTGKTTNPRHCEADFRSLAAS